MRSSLVAVFAVLAMTIGTRDAEAQARGSLQATATVVDTRQGFEALALVRHQVTNSRIESAHTVATVAQISTARPSPNEQTVVVTIDYSRN